MTTLTKKPASTSQGIPKKLAEFVDQRIGSMSTRQLRIWKRDSEKIMKDSKNRSNARRAARETSQ